MIFDPTQIAARSILSLAWGDLAKICRAIAREPGIHKETAKRYGLADSPPVRRTTIAIRIQRPYCAVAPDRTLLLYIYATNNIGVAQPRPTIIGSLHVWK